MTTTPAPRRGLFCAYFCVLCARFFSLHTAISRGFVGTARVHLFLCALFRTFAVFFARIFSKFRVFFCPTFSAVSAFFWWHFAAVSPPFLCCFLLCLQAAGQDHHGQPEPEAGRDRAALFFYVRFCRALGISQHPQSRTNRGRSGTRPAPMFVYAFPVFSCAFTVPFLCRHGCP